MLYDHSLYHLLFETVFGFWAVGGNQRGMVVKYAWIIYLHLEYESALLIGTKYTYVDMNPNAIYPRELPPTIKGFLIPRPNFVMWKDPEKRANVVLPPPIDLELEDAVGKTLENVSLISLGYGGVELDGAPAYFDLLVLSPYLKADLEFRGDSELEAHQEFHSTVKKTFWKFLDIYRQQGWYQDDFEYEYRGFY